MLALYREALTRHWCSLTVSAALLRLPDWKLQLSVFYLDR
jgi:hypothetical protein